MDSPAAVAAAAGLATLLLVAPGAVAAGVLRTRLLPSTALGATAVVAGISIVAVVAGVAGIPFGAWVVAPLAVAAAVAIALARRLVSAARERRLPLVVVWVLAAIVTAVVSSSAAGPGTLSLTYDGVFHLNAVARILDEGDASSFTLYQLTNPGDEVEFYPAAWHALVALVAGTGISIPAAASGVWLAVVVAIWVPGVAWLATTLLPPARRAAGALVAIALAVLLAGFPYLLLAWGTLYATGLAYALLPVGVTLLLRVLRLVPRGGPPWLDVALAAVWFAAAAFAHPRSLVTVAVVAAPIVLTAIVRTLARLARRPRGRRIVTLASAGLFAVTAATAVVGSMAILRYFGADVRPVSDRLNGGPALANQSPVDTVWQVLAQAPVLSPVQVAAPAAIGVALLALTGFVLAVRSPATLWLTVAFVALGALYAIAASSDADVAKILTGLWYKDKFRLSAALPMLAIPAGAIGATAAYDALRRRVARTGLRRGIVAVTAAAVVATAAPSLVVTHDMLGRVFTVPEAKDGALLDRDELALLERIADEVPADGVVAGNPWNGAALAWALGGRRALFPHLTGYWDPDRVTVAERLDEAADDPEVCAALERLGVTHLLHSDGLLLGGDATAEFYAGLDRASGAPGFTPVDREGGTTLYRVDACG